MTIPGKKNIVIGCAGALLLLAAGLLYNQLRDYKEHIGELERELAEMRKREKQAAVDRSVSHQMEEIARGQQILSEERSREAIRQSEIAQAATLRTEAERSRAVQAQAAAEASAQEALQSYQMAERQRREADTQRRQAVYARHVADTLNYISLGRTLGTQSYAIYQTGDREIGNMLAYAAYLYTSDYGGDLYAPAVFQALAQSAGSHSYWNVHRSSIPRMNINAANGTLLTVSTYGELAVHRMQGSRLVSRQLLNDKTYCFRDMVTTGGNKSYAVSSTGHLAIVDADRVSIIALEGIDKPFRLQSMGNSGKLLIVGEQDAALFDTGSNKMLATRHLDFRVVSVGNSNGSPLLFDNHGGMHRVASLENISSERVPVTGTVTAFTTSHDNRLTAYGMSDGTIWLIDAQGTKHRLVGHLSQVSRMRFHGGRLYSSGYDGKLFFWMVGAGQARPVALFQSQSWLMDFTFDAKGEHVWAGEANGTVSQFLVALPLIGRRLQANVGRNFTQDEWDYYVGKGIPYRKLKNEE